MKIQRTSWSECSMWLGRAIYLESSIKIYLLYVYIFFNALLWSIHLYAYNMYIFIYIIFIQEMDERGRHWKEHVQNFILRKPFCKCSQNVLIRYFLQPKIHALEGSKWKMWFAIWPEMRESIQTYDKCTQCRSTLFIVLASCPFNDQQPFNSNANLLQLC